MTPKDSGAKVSHIRVGRFDPLVTCSTNPSLSLLLKMVFPERRKCGNSGSESTCLNSHLLIPLSEVCVLCSAQRPMAGPGASENEALAKQLHVKTRPVAHRCPLKALGGIYLPPLKHHEKWAASTFGISRFHTMFPNGSKSGNQGSEFML